MPTTAKIIDSIYSLQNWWVKKVGSFCEIKVHLLLTNTTFHTITSEDLSMCTAVHNNVTVYFYDNTIKSGRNETTLVLLSVHDPSLTLTQFGAHLKTVLFCRAYETLA